MNIELFKDRTLTKQEAITIKQYRNEPAMSTLRIAEVTGKNHRDVLKDTRKIFTELEIEESRYSLLYKSENNQNTKHYMLPEFEFNMVISGYSIKYRASLIKELIEYRKSIPQKDPLTIAIETVAMLDREIEAERENSKLLNQFIDNTMGDENLISFEHTTKLMYERYAFSVGRNTLMKLLRDCGVLMASNRPYQRYANWFKVIKKKSYSGNIYDITLVYEDKIKMIYKYAMQELQTIEKEDK